MDGRRAARTPRLPLFEAGPPIAPALPPAQADGIAGPSRALHETVMVSLFANHSHLH